MPRPLPSCRLHKPSGRAVVTLDGKDVYLGKFGSPESLSNYHQVMAEWMEERRSRQPAASHSFSNITVSELLLAFWRHAMDHYRRPDGKPTGELDNLKVALRPVRQLYGLTPARDFGPLALRAVRDQMIADGLARTSANDRVNRIRRAFRWAASVELVPASVVHALGTVAGLQKGRTVARETDPVRPVPIEVVEATLPHLPRPVAGLVRLQMLTGMRPAEAFMMRGCELMPSERTWIYRPALHKTTWRGKERVIIIGPRGQALVKEFVKDDPEAYLFDPREAVAEHQSKRAAARKSKPTPSEKSKRVVTPGATHNRRYSRASYRNAIVRACDRAFPHPTLGWHQRSSLTEAEAAELMAWRKAHRWHPNQLRHTTATLIRSRYGLEAAQVVLGHSRADVTQVYAERDLDRARDIMAEIG